MIYFFRFLFLLINPDQEMLLNWFGIKNPNSQKVLGDNLNLTTFDNISIKTFRLIVEGLGQQVQDGLTLADIENLLFFILFIRFGILAIRYNLKTSFYITSIGLFAGYLWYRHLIDLISMYRNILINLPYLHNLGVDAIQLRSMGQQTVLTDLKIRETLHWYEPGKLIYYAFTKAIITTDAETGFSYYIDPISMIISNLKESEKGAVLPIYYKIYNKIIPQVFEGVSKFWTQLSGIAAYAVITRIGKRYCPYLVRWHWTFLLIIGFIEQILIYFVFRVFYFQSALFIPQTDLSTEYLDQNLLFQVNLLNGLIGFIVCIHFGFIFFGLFHAIWGQYFYFPFLVENTELHIGPRPKNSIYSGGYTAWQDKKEKNIHRIVPRFWYGWFGRGKTNHWSLLHSLQSLIRNLIKQVRKQFRQK